jgi:putative DNA primase/helicase
MNHQTIEQQNYTKTVSVDANDVMLKAGQDELIRQYNQDKKSKQKEQEHKANAQQEQQTTLSMLDKLLALMPEIDFESRLRQETAEQHLASYITKGGNLKIPNRLYSVLIIEEILNIANKHNIDICRHYDENVKIPYIFNGKYWEVIDGNRLKDFLTQCAIKSGYMKLESKTPTFQNLLNETFWCNSTFQKINKDNLNTTLVNLNNCTLEINEHGVIVTPHNKEHFLLYKLAFDHDIKATAPQFQQYLAKVLPDEQSQQLLQEVIGYVFTKHLKLEKCAILFGSGSNGKSVFFDIMMALLGVNNVTNFSLKHLAEEHNRAMLDGKLLNYGSEINSGIDNDIFKQLASGEPVQARHKYGHSFTIHNYARLIFNANELPRATEHTTAYFRRFLLVHFDQVIDSNNADFELAKKIINTELAGVMNWVIDGVKRLQHNKKFSYCAKSEELLATYKKDSDVVALFLEDGNYKPSTSYRQLMLEIYSDFKRFCIDNGYCVMANKTVTKRLRDLGYDIKRGTANRSFIGIVQLSN